MKHYSIVTLTYLGQNLEIMEKCQEMKEKPLDSIGKSTGEKTLATAHPWHSPDTDTQRCELHNYVLTCHILI